VDIRGGLDRALRRTGLILAANAEKAAVRDERTGWGKCITPSRYSWAHYLGETILVETVLIQQGFSNCSDSIPVQRDYRASPL
jgi:hypothetical protein